VGYCASPDQLAGDWANAKGVMKKGSRDRLGGGTGAGDEIEHDQGWLRTTVRAGQ